MARKATTLERRTDPKKRAAAISKKTGSGGLGQAARKLRKQKSERQRALKELLGS